jgi:hypothetical protein
MIPVAPAGKPPFAAHTSRGEAGLLPGEPACIDEDAADIADLGPGASLVVAVACLVLVASAPVRPGPDSGSVGQMGMPWLLCCSSGSRPRLAGWPRPTSSSRSDSAPPGRSVRGYARLRAPLPDRRRSHCWSGLSGLWPVRRRSSSTCASSSTSVQQCATADAGRRRLAIDLAARVVAWQADNRYPRSRGAPEDSGPMAAAAVPEPGPVVLARGRVVPNTPSLGSMGGKLGSVVSSPTGDRGGRGARRRRLRRARRPA